MRNKTVFASADDANALRDGLAEIYAKTQSYRLTGIAIGASGAYARLLVLGKRRPTQNVLDAWQIWTTRRPIEYVSTPACPIHGVPHIADCHGAEVAAVVTLAPGETVKRPGKTRTRKHYHRPCMDDATYELWLAFKAAREQLEEDR